MNHLSEKRIFYVMFLPAIIVLVIITLFPFIYAVFVSLTDMQISRPQLGSPFIGLRNYLDLFTGYRFWNSFKVTFVFSFFALLFELLIGFGLAYLLKDEFRGRQIVIALLIAPIVIPPIVSGLTWRFMYDANIGFINYLIGFFGVNAQAWLGNPSLALPAIIITDIWQWTPFVMLVILSGIQAIPIEPFEAARIDGASNWQILKYIMLPMLKSVVLVVLLLRTIELFRTFDTIYIMTEGGPGVVTEAMSIHSYLQGFQFFNTGKASAFAMIMLVTIIFICQLYVKYGGGNPDAE